MNDKMTIRDAYEKLPDTADREYVIAKIQAMTGATRKAIVRKLNSLEDIGGIEDSNLESALKELDDNKYLSQEEEIDEDVLDALENGDIEEVPMEDSVNLALMKENSKLRRIVKKMSAERGGHNILLSEITDQIPKIVPLPIAYKANKNSDKKMVTEVWHFTDWHIGEMIDKDEIEGLNSFNYKIADQRVNIFVEKALDWTKLHRNSYTVDELVILCTGDMVSGDIHDELTRTNEFPLPEQCAKSGALIARAVSTAAAHFKKVRVEYIVADNHSRLLHKPQAKQAGYNSMNYIVGTIAKLMLEKHPNVEFNLHPVVYQLVKIQNTKYLCCHGNNIRSFGAIPRAGMAKLVGMESFYRMKKDMNLRFDKLVIGHYHSASIDQTTIMGSSLTGSNEYDRNCGRLGRASQTAWFIYDNFEFDFTEFFLD